MLPRSKSVLVTVLVFVAIGLTLGYRQFYRPPESKGAPVDPAPDDTKGMRAMPPNVLVPAPVVPPTSEPSLELALPPLCDISLWRDARDEANKAGVIELPPNAAYKCAAKTGNATLSEALTDHEKDQLATALETLATACARAPKSLPGRIAAYNPCQHDVHSCGTALNSSQIASFVLEARDHKKIKLAKMFYVGNGGGGVKNQPSELYVGATISRPAQCGPIIALAFTEQGRDRTDAQIALTLAHEWAHAHNVYCGPDAKQRVAAFEDSEIRPREVELILVEALCHAAERGEYPCQVDPALWWGPRIKLYDAIVDSGCCERMQLSAAPDPADEGIPDCNCWKRQ